MNRDDFADLYDHHYPQVFRYLLWRLHDRDAAEELTAEVFAVALTALQNGNAPRHIGGWFLGVADQLASRSDRKERAEHAVPADRSSEQDPEELALGRMECAVIWRCVDALSPEHQQVLLLRIVAGLSAREVGEVMGKTEDAVRSLQLRALQAFYGRWKEAEAGAKRHR